MFLGEEAAVAAAQTHVCSGVKGGVFCFYQHQELSGLLFLFLYVVVVNGLYLTASKLASLLAC